MATKKQTGWLVRDPKGRVVGHNGLVLDTRMNAIRSVHAYRLVRGMPLYSENMNKFWRKVCSEGYTMERIEL